MTNDTVIAGSWLGIGMSFVLVVSGAVYFLMGNSTVVGGEDVMLEKQASAMSENSQLIEDLGVDVVLLDDLSCMILDDFDSGSLWQVVNDGVMGGRSRGEFTITDSILSHTGNINTNGGGFSSVRTRLPVNTLDGYSRAVIRLNTNGRSYGVRLEDSRYRNVSHSITIDSPVENDWQEISFDFADTVPTSFGRSVDAQSFEVSAINGLGFMLSDGVDGPFDISVDWIKICS